MRRYTCESVLRNRRITRLPETIIRGCRNYEQYLSFQPRNYLPMCVRLQRITENSKYCAISSRVLRESISTREGKSSIRRVSHSTSALRREFSTVVRRFPYSVRKGRRPASNDRVAFPCSRCSMRAQMYRTHFALKRFLCFRISSNTFPKRKCLYFGGRNVKRISRSSFNFFYVPLVKKKKKKKGEREKSEKALSTSSRVSHSKNFEATRKCSAETPFFASFRGKREPRNTRGTKYSTNIRVNGAF